MLIINEKDYIDKLIVSFFFGLWVVLPINHYKEEEKEVVTWTLRWNNVWIDSEKNPDLMTNFYKTV